MKYYRLFSYTLLYKKYIQKSTLKHLQKYHSQINIPTYLYTNKYISTTSNTFMYMNDNTSTYK